MVGMVGRLWSRLPLIRVIQIRIYVVQVFFATGAGQELPPISFELGSTR